MPLVRIDTLTGRTREEIKTLLDATHQAILSAFQVPERDRYQIYHEHPPQHLIVQDTGLGITRTNAVIVVTVTSRPRSTEAKQLFYNELCQQLQKRSGIAPSDVVVSFITNSDADWSFGKGRAQFLTGEL